MTIWEKKGRLEGLKLAYSGIVGHGAGTSNEFLVACPKLGMDLAIGVPYEDNDAGAVSVLYGTANGITMAVDPIVWTT